MDAKLIYWNFALVNLTLLVVIALYGVYQIPRRRIRRHHRSMWIAVALVVTFLVSYAFKLAWLGREDRSVWSGVDLTVLRVHETFVLAMLVAGGLTLWRARGFRSTRHYTERGEDPPAPAARLQRHRRAGWVALVSAVLGLLTAAMVLVGMYRRAGLL